MNHIFAPINNKWNPAAPDSQEMQSIMHRFITRTNSQKKSKEEQQPYKQPSKQSSFIPQSGDNILLTGCAAYLDRYIAEPEVTNNMLMLGRRASDKWKTRKITLCDSMHYLEV